MVIVGLTGDIGSGKTTFGTFLGQNAKQHIHLESSELIAEVANDLKLNLDPQNIPSSANIAAINDWLDHLPGILKQRTNTEVNVNNILLDASDIVQQPDLYSKLFNYLALIKAKPDLISQEITASNKAEHRALLQWLGGYLAKRVSIHLWFKELLRRGKLDSSIDLLTVGGVRFPGDAECIKHADGYIISLQRPGQVTQDKLDITERERASVVADTQVINNSGLLQLELIAKTVWADLKANNLKSVYTANLKA